MPAHRDLPRHRLFRRQRERSGIGDHQPLDLRMMRQRPAEPDHAAPVVYRQRDRAGDAQMPQQRVQVVHARLQRVVVTWLRVGRIVRLVGQAHADMVRHDAAVTVRQAAHQIPPQVAPRRIAVQHHDHLAIARTFVQIRHRNTGTHLKALGSEGIAGVVHAKRIRFDSRERTWRKRWPAVRRDWTS